MAGLPGADSVALVLHRVFFHSRLEALFEPAEPTLVSLVLVHHAVTTEPAGVIVFLPDRTAEKSLAAVARRCAVVLACRTVLANCTVL